jgi:hypothetical protein
MNPNGWTKWLTALVLCPAYFGLLALCVILGGDDDTIPAFRRKSADEQAFFAQVGQAVIRAAHPTGVDPQILNMELKEDSGRPHGKVLSLQLRYRGRVTGRLYQGASNLFLDTHQASAWKVSRVDYQDDNSIPPNRPALDALLRQLNR